MGDNDGRPRRIGESADWVMVDAGYSGTVALRSDGSLWTWGPEDSGIPVRVGSDNGWTAASVGTGHTLALRQDGSLWAWGVNHADHIALQFTII